MTAVHGLNIKAAQQSYKVHVGSGLLDKAGELCRPYLSQGRAILVVDDALVPLYGARLEKAFHGQGIKTLCVSVPSGEASKSFSGLERLVHQLLKLGVERSDTLIALGGGVIGDLAGFAAAIFKRGMDLIHMPTSLLAQVDSCLGGKTGINMPQGKNLVGAFHAPRLVIADTDILETLPERRLREGYAEVLKYALIGDKGFFAWLDTCQDDFFRGHKAVRIEAITRSMKAKAHVIEKDEYEKGERAFLNFGHSFAHALEAETGYGDTLYHGEAVALGMMMALRFSACLSSHLAIKSELSEETCQKVEEHIKRAGLPVRLDGLDHAFSPKRLLERMVHDKKTRRGQITLVLLCRLGEAALEVGVDPDMLLDFLTMEVRGQMTT